MTKKRSLLLFSVAIIVFLMSFIALSGQKAYADTADPNDITTVVLDVTARDENNIYVDLEQPALNQYAAEFGSKVVLHARPDDDDNENPDELYNEITMFYQWWYAAPGSEEYVSLSDRIVGEANVTLELTTCAESGSYYVLITAIRGRTQPFYKQSEPVSIEIKPKKLSIEYTSFKKAYTGVTQNIEYEIKGEVPGHPANCIVETDSATAEVGIYSVRVIAQNPNYLLEELERLFVITPAPLTVSASDVVVLAGYDYSIDLQYEGFLGYDDPDSLPFRPYVNEADLKLAYIGPGFYTVTPVVPENDKSCSENSVTITNAQLVIEYCDCNGLGRVASASGDLDNVELSAHSSAKVPYAVLSFFDRLSLSCAAFESQLTPSSAFLRDEDISDDALESYKELFSVLQTLSDGSFYASGASLEPDKSALIGIGKSYAGYMSQSGFFPVKTPTAQELSGYYENTEEGFVRTTGSTLVSGIEYYRSCTYDEIIKCLSRLMGYKDQSSFVEYALRLAEKYAENPAGASDDSTAKRLLYDGGVYTSNGSLVLPFLFQSTLADDFYVYVVFDADGTAAVWISDVDALLSAGNYEDKDLAEKKTVKAIGRCLLFEFPPMNYTISVSSCTVQVNRSVLNEDSVIGFSGKATGSFSSDASISITDADKEAIKNVFAFWKVPSAVYALRFSGTSNKESYTVIMENVTLPGLTQSICFVNDEGVTETISSYKYNKDKKTLTLHLTQTSGYIVVYNNWLWIVVPSAIILIIVISLLLFHHRDRKKHKLNRLISGSAKAEADRYRKMIGEHEEKERRKI